MGNGNFGEANLGKDIFSGSSSKKSKESSKPKKPRRGLGVAALEKLRLQKEYGLSYVPSPQGPLNTNSSQEPVRIQIQEPYSSPPLSSIPGYFQRLLMGTEELGRRNDRFGGSQFSTTTSLIPADGMLKSQQFTEPNMTRHFMDLPVAEPVRIQIQEAYSSPPLSSVPGYFQRLLMAAEELGRGNNRFGGSQFSTTTRYHKRSKRWKKNASVRGSFCQFCGTSDAQELDLELKLSL